MVGLTVIIHFAGLLGLMWVLRARGHRFRAHESAVGQGAAIVFVVLGLVAILTIEIWLYGVVYLSLGALPDFESALYFSTTSFTTIGYGDVVLEKLAPVRRGRGSQRPAVIWLVDSFPDLRHGPHAHIGARLAGAPGTEMIAIAVETPLQDDVRVLVAELNATLLELTPPEFVFHHDS